MKEDEQGKEEEGEAEWRVGLTDFVWRAACPGLVRTDRGLGAALC
jgi:hypothetical protein